MKKQEFTYLPCPFCGNKDIQIFPEAFGYSTIANGFRVRCWRCSASVFEITNYEDCVIAKWNRRT